jgi:hypothetical protein
MGACPGLYLAAGSFGPAEHLQFNRHRAGVHHVEAIGCCPGKIHDPAPDMGPAIGNLHFYGLAILLIGDLHLRAEGQGFMGRGKFTFAVAIAVGHFFTLEFVAVIRGFAYLGKLSAAGAGGNGDSSQ